MNSYNDYNESPYQNRRKINKHTPIKSKMKPNGISYILNSIDSNSELYKNSKNKVNKLVTDKVENQVPTLNKEYFKKNYEPKKKIRCSSNLKNNERINNNSILDDLKIVTNKKRHHGSTKVVHNSPNNNDNNESTKMIVNRYMKPIKYKNENNYIYNNKNYVRKNKDINLYPKNNETLYDNYRELIKLNTFKKLAKSNYRIMNSIKRNYYRVNVQPDKNQKLVKIQAVWRGAYFRTMMRFCWDVDNFINKLDNIFKGHIYNYFFDFVKNTTHFRKKSKDDNIIDDYQSVLMQKEEDYKNLLKQYNKIVEQFNQYKELENKNKKEEENIKYFDKLKIDQKEQFNIIKESDSNGIKLREKYKNKKKETYKNYIEYFTKNIQIVKNEQIMIEENQKKEEKNIIAEEVNQNNNAVEEIQKEMNILIKRQKKKRCEKMTEITSELNQLIPYNNKELYYEGISKKNRYINNNKQELSFIRSKNREINKEINLEIKQEISLEINPYTIKKSEIRKENEIEILFNKYSFFTRKAKDNLVKIILPIKLKMILKELAYKYLLSLLSNIKKDE